MYMSMVLPLTLQVFEFHLLYPRFEILEVLQDSARISVSRTVAGGAFWFWHFLVSLGRQQRPMSLDGSKIAGVKNVWQLNGGAKKRLSVASYAAKFVACRLAMRRPEQLNLIRRQVGDDQVIASVRVFTNTIPSEPKHTLQAESRF
jgi:hypothetical protein